VLPISAHAKGVLPIPASASDEVDAAKVENPELTELKASLADTQPIGSLAASTKTLDQAKALLTFVDGIADKSLRNTVTLTAARGRGKSASLGLAIAAAVSYGCVPPFQQEPQGVPRRRPGRRVKEESCLPPPLFFCEFKICKTSCQGELLSATSLESNRFLIQPSKIVEFYIFFLLYNGRARWTYSLI
jgi:hypothetical protein